MCKEGRRIRDGSKLYHEKFSQDTPHQTLLVWQNTLNKLDQTYSTNGGQERCIQGVGEETRRDQFEEAGVHERIILKQVFNRYVESPWTGLVSLDSIKRKSFCERGNELSFLTKRGNFISLFREISAFGKNKPPLHSVNQLVSQLFAQL